MRFEKIQSKSRTCSVKGCGEVARWIIQGDSVEEQKAIEKALLAVGGIKMGHIPSLETFRKFNSCLMHRREIRSAPSMAS